ncbi:MAG: hypothetical protein ACRD2H_09205 [Terriglobales bacterium]
MAKNAGVIHSDEAELEPHAQGLACSAARGSWKGEAHAATIDHGVAGGTHVGLAQQRQRRQFAGVT